MKRVISHWAKSVKYRRKQLTFGVIVSSAMFTALTSSYYWDWEPQTLLGVLGGIVALGSFFVTSSLEKARFQRELFLKFNEQYDQLNGPLGNILNALQANPSVELRQIKAAPDSRQNPFEDYFNLCAEEFYYFRKGYVDREVWENWARGMQYWYDADKRITDYWDEELKKDSYYGLTAADIRGDL